MLLLCTLAGCNSFNDAFAGMLGVAAAPIDKTTPAHNAFIDAWTSNAIVCNNDTRTSGNTKRTYDTVLFLDCVAATMQLCLTIMLVCVCVM